MRIMKYSQIQKHKGHKKSLKKDSNFFGILALTDNKTKKNKYHGIRYILYIKKKGNLLSHVESVHIIFC